MDLPVGMVEWSQDLCIGKQKKDKAQLVSVSCINHRLCYEILGLFCLSAVHNEVWIHRLEPRHEISNNVVCATSKASDQPAHTRRLIRGFASRLSIL